MLRKINKIISVLLACILSVLSIPTYAAENKEILSENCYIASSSCPQEYMDFAEEKASDFVLSVDESLKDSTVAVGMPFSFATSNADVYYFPIICDGVISYLFRVYPYGDGFCGVITDFLAKDIEMLSSLTTQENPLYLRLIDKKIIASVGESNYLLFEYPESMSQPESAVYTSINETFTVVNVKQTADISLDLHRPTVMRTSQRASITWLDKSEQQGNNNWCAAYCLAAIIRTRTSHKDIKARDCMKDAYGYVPSTDNSFPRTKMATVANMYGLYPTVTNSLVNDYILYDQIEDGRPVIQSMESLGGSNRHAVVLMGYNLINSTWGIWNPWYKSFEWYSMSGVYIPMTVSGTNDNTYLPYRHAYNF